MLVVVVVKIELKWCEIMCVFAPPDHFHGVVTHKQDNTWCGMLPWLHGHI
jgi:hypothetical protein